MTWNANFPLNATSVSGSVAPDPNSQIRDNWEAIEDWWDADHQTFTSAGSGGHTAGKVGIMLVDTSTAVTAATAPGTGSMGYDTTNGQVLIYRTTGWERLPANQYSRLRVGFVEHSIPHDTWTKIITAGTTSGSYDTLSEFSSVTGRFTVANTGLYFIKATIRFPAVSINYQKGIAIGLNGIIWSKSTNYGITVRNIDVADILSLVAGDYVELYGYHDYVDPVTIVYAQMHIIRLS